MDRISLLNSFRNKATLSIYYGMALLVLIAGAVYVWRGNWESALTTAFVFLLMTIPSILKERYRLYLPFGIELGIVAFIFVTLFLGEVARFYDWIPFWDKFVHFQSGILLSASGYILVYTLNEHQELKLGLSPGFVSIFAVTFSLALGALWEIAEFTVDSLIGSEWQFSNSDTMWDLIADGSGALIISLIGYFWMHRHKRLPLTPWLLKIKEKFRPQNKILFPPEV